MKFRSAYSDRSNEDYSLICPEKVLTSQADAGLCDVNNIVSRWQKSGGAVDLSVRVGQFLDVSDVPDFQACNNFVIGAKNLFMSLPADVRYKFQNDPSLFLDFALDPANEAEMVKMGLSKPVAAPAAPSESASAGDATGGRRSRPECS